MNAVEVGNESGVNGGISKVVLHHTEFALSAFFPSIELNSLALYCLEFTLMCLIPVNISNNTRVFEVYDGIVDKELRCGRGMEEIKIVVLDPRMTEIGGRICLCVKGNGVFGVSPFANSYNVSVNSGLSEGNISCYFVLPVLIEEDKRVLLYITVVVLTLSSSWMVRIVELLSELGNIGNGARCGREGDCGVIHSKLDGFVTLNIIVQHVTFNFVKDLRDEKEVFNSGVITKGSGKYLVVKLSVP